ncbi:hypothetical protein GCM10009844_45200 [Nocardioides koreensis]|uniref:WD40 repeat domain-containing protein n=1 Tax=Nocardioides koreensis TaxID=433651 RepID=A0ABP5LYW9_9ACTN
MTMLHDRLADLADEAPASLPTPGLWDRGRRYRRRRRTGTLAVLGAAVLVLALLGGVTWHRGAPPVQPATGSVGLPDRVWTPSPWLPTTARPGRLVAVTGAKQGSWTGMSPGVVGISAITGEYAFLELPDLNPSHVEEVALSPDGGHVAYWLSGETEGTPNTLFSSESVAGVAVLDTATGTVQQHRIPTEHGIEPGLLTWVDADRVAFEAGQIVAGDDGSEMDQGSTREGPLMVWQPGQTPAPVAANGASGTDVIAAGHGRLVVADWSTDDPGRFRVIDLDDRSQDRRVGLPGPDFQYGNRLPVAIDASGQQLARVEDGRSPNRIRAGRFFHQPQVPRSGGTFAVLGWLDEDTLMVWRRADRGPLDRTVLGRVSVRTGAFEEKVRFPRLVGPGNVQFATDLLDAPSVHAEAPPRPLDPRVVTGLAVGTVLAAGVALLLWRRRVRP